MNAPASSPSHRFALAGETLEARPTGALVWPARGWLVVSDLHLGKSERLARRGGALLPPYETEETVARLAAEVEAVRPEAVICLGDSFDDLEVGAALPAAATERLSALAAGRRWIWIAGNHDAGPPELPGEHRAELRAGALVFRHEAGALEDGTGEVSGHWHPKARLVARGRRVSRPCFVVSGARAILPAFGAYTGGLDARAAPLARLAPEGTALLTGRRVVAAPLAALGR
ncbi:MAG TPA: ligase-associated DNA damage response endonuclease PdeM [Paracoccaceae bacterium]|nr:ligase-associated DNA damage response endonuclease PdeM [Paracoccaceae bacterium]